MGITLSSKNLSVDMGYGGFLSFRERVAMLASDEFGQHYSTLRSSSFLFGEQRESFFNNFDNKTNEMLAENKVAIEVVDFVLQSDCEGKIKCKQAIMIYEKIKDYDDNIAYGYAGRSDCATFASIKAIFKDCVDNGGKIKWH